MKHLPSAGLHRFDKLTQTGVNGDDIYSRYSLSFTYLVLSICVSNYLSSYLMVCLVICLPIYLLVYASIYLSIPIYYLYHLSDLRIRGLKKNTLRKRLEPLKRFKIRMTSVINVVLIFHFYWVIPAKWKL